MNDEPATGPAEQRLGEHLELLRTSPPAPGAALVPRVVRRARWQGYLQEPLRVVGMLGVAFAQGLASLLGGSRKTP
jgi:hypothetical protein